ncbi:MAG TPA: beta-propeller fold lactonase family protein, partial [Pseudomonadaceae bacterium]|nr:beta-propeller fold lactonase family protein [Pseudomonadaceae bacterium]
AGEVARLDVSTNTIVLTKSLQEIDGVKPKGVLLSPDEKTLYVSTGRANSIAVLDAETLELQDTIAVGNRVWGIALSRDGSRLYAANGVSGTLSVVDTAAREEIATVEVGDMPWGVVLDD